MKSFREQVSQLCGSIAFSICIKLHTPVVKNVCFTLRVTIEISLDPYLV